MYWPARLFCPTYAFLSLGEGYIYTYVHVHVAGQTIRGLNRIEKIFKLAYLASL